MCELFALSSNHPANVTFSLTEFSKHGGLTGPHKDGWGIAFYADKHLQHSIAHPIGNTDSEYVFCSLMNIFKGLWNSQQVPTIEESINLVAYFSSLIRPYGPANFIYSDSELLFAHGHKRTHKDENKFRPPGLHILSRACLIDMEKKQDIKGLDIQSSQEEQKVMLIASIPLSSENWEPLNEGESSGI